MVVLVATEVSSLDLVIVFPVMPPSLAARRASAGFQRAASLALR